MSRRSSRTPSVSAVALPASVQRGLASLCEFDSDVVSKMLSLSSSGPQEDLLVKIMAVNQLSAEMVLARFFDKELLGAYSEKRLGKSGKGDAATLAARIAREWAKPTFSPLSDVEASGDAPGDKNQMAVKRKAAPEESDQAGKR
ncbi:hypothetical protein T492DRAFT_1108714 [Pavlovales sp. CCMP2436]|nr:hypothetical protein T492DRAFT_1108714 [Pavlovales sp. CCMP2436]